MRSFIVACVTVVVNGVHTLGSSEQRIIFNLMVKISVIGYRCMHACMHGVGTRGFNVQTLRLPFTLFQGWHSAPTNNAKVSFTYCQRMQFPTHAFTECEPACSIVLCSFRSWSPSLSYGMSATHACHSFSVRGAWQSRAAPTYELHFSVHVLLRNFSTLQTMVAP